MAKSALQEALSHVPAGLFIKTVQPYATPPAALCGSGPLLAGLLFSRHSTCMTNLEGLIARQPEVIFVSPFQRGEIGPDLFRGLSAGWTICADVTD